MPDQNQSDPNNSTPTIDPVVSSTPVVPSVDTTVTTSTVQQPVSAPSAFFPTEDTPPVPAFQTVTTTTPETTTTTTVTSSPVQPAVVDDQSSGSAAPADFPPMTSSPKKKFAGGKVIATILGLFVLIGGVGAGIFLTQQNQQFNQKASGGCPSHSSHDSCTGACSQPDDSGDTYKCSWDSGDSSCGKSNNLCSGGGTGGGLPLCIAGQRSNKSNQCTQGQASTCQKDSSNKNTGYSCTCVNAPADGQTVDSCEPWNWQCTTFDTKQCPSDNPGGNAGTCGNTNADAYQKVGGCIKFNGTGVGSIWSYECQNQTNGNACNLNGVLHTVSQGQSVCLDTKPATWCGSQQIDGGQGATCFVSRITTTCATNPPGSSISAQCVNIKAYNTNWAVVSDAVLKTLKAGAKLNFCVTGTTTAGSFDRARFTINGVLQPDTTTQRPGTQDYCQAYTIPAAKTTFNVTAQIHHVTLDWK